MRFWKYIAFMVMLLAINACNTPSVYQKSFDFENNEWRFEEALLFEFNTEDTLNQHHMMVQFRHEGKYAYSNLWLFIEFTSPKGNIVTDTIELPLARPTGEWLGKGIGDLVDHLILIKRDVRFPTAGNYQVKVKHGMRKNALSNVVNLGLRIEKSGA